MWKGREKITKFVDLENKKSFLDEKKIIFHSFKGLSLGEKIKNSVTTFKSPLSGLRQFLTTKRLLQMMKNTFHFTLRALFVPEIFKYLSLAFAQVEKRFG